MRAFFATYVALAVGGCDARAPAITAEAPAASASSTSRAATDPLAPAPPLPEPSASGWTPPECPGGGCNQPSVVAGMSAGFRRCSRLGFANDPRMKGKVEVHAKIGRSGEVVSVEPKATGLPPDVVRCVADRVAKATFPPPEGGSASVVIPVTFVPE